MNPSDGLLVETLSKPTVLVIEDNSVFLENAKKALGNCCFLRATDLEKALGVMKVFEVHFVLSEVCFPAKEGERAKEHMLEVLLGAAEIGVPVCFVAQAGHLGSTEKNGDCLSICALTTKDISRTLREAKEGGLFSHLRSSDQRTVRVYSKTPEIWKLAFDMLRNACTKPAPALGHHIRASGAVPRQDLRPTKTIRA